MLFSGISEITVAKGALYQIAVALAMVTEHVNKSIRTEILQNYSGRVKYEFNVTYF